MRWTILLFPLISLAAQNLGEFESQTTIGESARPGAAEFDAARRTYRLTGGGANMWGAADAFHFVWKKLSGDFTLTADVQFEDTGGNAHRKAGWVVRQGLEPGAPYADLVVHGDGLTSLQFRTEAGGETREVRVPVSAPVKLRLERRGDIFRAWVARTGEELQPAGSTAVVLPDPVYVGLGVCSHDAARMETALFSSVEMKAAPAERTVVGIRGPQFTINGRATYTPEAGFPAADPLIAGTLLNVRAVQAIFDDANYPQQGTRERPYQSNTMGAVQFEYPDGKWDPDRNTREFTQALPEWRRAGLQAFTVNLQGGGPTDGNYGENGPTQPHLNSGFDAEGNLKPAYAERLRRVISAADRLGMIVIVGFFYQGEDERVTIAPDNRYVRRAITNGVEFLKSLPHRNVLIEINNETSVGGYSHPILQPDGAVEAVALAKQVAAGEFPVSMSWSGGIQPRGSRGDRAIQLVDYVMFHTNGRTPEEVHETIVAMRRWAGYSRPLLINEDGVSTFNLHAAAEERVGWGYYDQGWNNYRDGFQSPPTNWTIGTPVKWLFFEQVARLTGSAAPPRPRYDDAEAPLVKLVGLKPGQILRERAWIEAVVEDRHARWPIKRVEFFIDGKPYSYRRNAPFMLGGVEWWNPAALAPGKHVLRVVAYDMRGPRFTETCAILDVPFAIAR
ncbi:MAG: hypothetical protein NT090_22510 [Acidobacteria bacterium]|nr:hypothetical protein [Acidobacteriota bacterium]